MIKKLKNKGLIIALNVLVMTTTGAASAFGQAAQGTGISPLEQTFYNSGKIYVVVAVAGIILTGIFVVLIRTERKLVNLERDFRKQTKEA